MRLLLRNSSISRLQVKNGYLNVSAYYSRRGRSNDSDYKVVSPAKSLKDKTKSTYNDGGYLWELLKPENKRFYLPNSLALGWQSTRSVVPLNVDLYKLIDFESKDANKLHFSTSTCPELVRDSLEDFFPKMKVSHEITVITLSYHKDKDVENGAKNFVVAARQICKELNCCYGWADFLNPFSGKAFVFYDPHSKLYDIHKTFRGNGMKYKNNCLVMEASDNGATFSGNIFTTVTPENIEKAIRMYMKLRHYAIDIWDEGDGFL